MATFVPRYDVVGRGPRLALILHGILGSGRGWRGFALRLAEALPGWRFALVDLRNHGRSHGAPPPHTVATTAADLTRIGAAEGALPQAVIGHSFGGKVALQLARDHAPALAQGAQVWVLDATPDAPLAPLAPRVPTEKGTADVALGVDVRARHRVLSLVETLRALPMPVERRQVVRDLLLARGFPQPIPDWMTTNLRPTAGGLLTWRFDLDAVDEMLASYLATDLWGVVEAPPDGISLRVVRAGLSPAWTPVARARLEAAAGALGARRLQVHVLPEAGHWVHVDAPDALRALLAASLRVPVSR